MIEQGQELAPGPAVQRQSRLSKPLAAVWDLAVQTFGLPQGSFSRLFPRESLKALKVFV